MAENSKIAWTHNTFNPWVGCTKVAPGCAHCYAETLMDTRYGKVVWGPSGTRFRTTDAYWREPLAWNRKAAAGECPDCNGGRKHKTHESGYGYELCETCMSTGKIGPHRRRVFCASLADVFEDWRGPIKNSKGLDIMMTEDRGPMTMSDVRRDLFRLIDKTPNLDWLLLTKRPENIRRMIPVVEHEVRRGGVYEGTLTRKFWPNVWLGTSCSEQKSADEVIPELIKCRDLAPVLFVSYEPAIGLIDFRPWLEIANEATTGDFVRSGFRPEISWIIVGGESGPNSRPCDIAWIRSTIEQCKAAGVPVFVKQLGRYPTWSVADIQQGWHELLSDQKGGKPSEWPWDIRVQQFPKMSKSEVTA